MISMIVRLYENAAEANLGEFPLSIHGRGYLVKYLNPFLPSRAQLKRPTESGGRGMKTEVGVQLFTHLD
jgi:hypothetical protein